jgi:hypothetical protein
MLYSRVCMSQHRDTETQSLTQGSLVFSVDCVRKLCGLRIDVVAASGHERTKQIREYKTSFDSQSLVFAYLFHSLRRRRQVDAYAVPLC